MTLENNTINTLSIFDFETEINKEKYAIINGNETLLFIKAGLNGSCYGYNNKYVTIAKNINQKFGYSVACVSNLNRNGNPLERDLKVIHKLFKNEIKRIYYMGYSNGALIGACYTHLFQDIQKSLLINSPIIQHWLKIKPALQKINTPTTFIFSDQDPSFPYIELLTFIKNSQINISIIKNTDHYFSNKLDEFIHLAEKYFAP